MTPLPTLDQVQELSQSANAAWRRWQPEIQYRTEAGLVLAISAMAILGLAIWRFARWVAPYLAAALLWTGHQLERFPQEAVTILDPADYGVQPEVAEAIHAFAAEYREDLAAIQEEPTPKPKRTTRQRSSTKATRGFTNAST